MTTIGDYVNELEAINRCKKLIEVLVNFFNSSQDNMELFERYWENNKDSYMLINLNKSDFNINELCRASMLLSEHAEMLKKIVVDDR